MSATRNARPPALETWGADRRLTLRAIAAFQPVAGVRHNAADA